MRITLTFILTFLFAGNLYSQQIEVISTGFNNSFGKIQVPSENSIYILDDNTSTLLSSLNAGTNWDSISLICDSTYYRYSGIQFLDENTGYIWGVAGSPFTHGLRPYFLKTTDKGISWNVINDGLPQKGVVTGANFLSPLKGYAFLICEDHNVNGGHNIELFYTEDGGNYWTQNLQPNSFTGDITKIDFIDGDDGFATGISNNLFFSKTEDGGISWQSTTLNNMGGNGSGIKFFSTNEGFLFASDSIFKTNDGGVTWSRNKFPFSQNITAIDFIDENSAYCISDNKVYYSEDKCNTWNEIYNGNDLYFADLKIRNNTVFITATNGYVVKIAHQPTSIQKLATEHVLKVYPNPTNGSSIVKLKLSSPAFVKLELYNILGDHMETLENNNYNSGEHKMDLNIENYPSGVYFLKGSINGTEKLIKISKY